MRKEKVRFRELRSLSLIHIYPRIEEWFASKRLDVFLSENGVHSCFGENGEMYPLSYFGDILQISEVQEPKPGDILDRIEREIDEGRYIIIYLNFTTLLNDTEHEAPYIHEVLIYGYDAVSYTHLISMSRMKRE